MTVFVIILIYTLAVGVESFLAFVTPLINLKYVRRKGLLEAQVNPQKSRGKINRDLWQVIADALDKFS
jgi:hypothetical protein